MSKNIKILFSLLQIALNLFLIVYILRELTTNREH